MRIRMLFDRLLHRLSRETTSGRFIPELDGLRFVAIGMVILYHLNGYLIAKTSFYEQGATPDWLCRAALVGNHGVELFFVISGFILALPFASHYLSGTPAVRLRAYFLRRLTRLEPPYFVTILLFVLLGVLMTRTMAPSLNGHLLASLFYFHNLAYGTQSPALGVAWSLEIEVQFYVLVPVLTLIFAVRQAVLRRSIVAGAIVLSLALQAAFLRGGLYPRVHLSIVAYLQFFLLGFLLADLYLSNWSAARARSFTWDGVSIAGWPLLFYVLRFPGIGHWIFPALVFVLYVAAFRGAISNRLISAPWITAIGGMCYSIYLVHYEVISAVGRLTRNLGQALPGPIYFAMQGLLVGSAIVVVCGAYFVLLEKPCMRRDWPQRARSWISANLATRERKAQPAQA